MAQTTRTFRIFVSSTFSDLKEERNALQKYVFPRLRELCTQHGCRFQAIDLRWGVREEAGLDQQTMKICLDEVGRSQRASPRPNFIVLLGDRYGWRPLPAEIPAREFEHILERVTAKEKELLLWKDEQPEGRKGWYRRDDNARFRRDDRSEPEPVYCLQPRSGSRFEEFQVWEQEAERPLRAILLRGIEGLDLTEDERRKYEASATEQEIAAGALSIPDAPEHVFCYFRAIRNLPRGRSAKDFVDLDENDAPDADAADKLEELKNLLKEKLPGNTKDYSADWTGVGAVSTGPIDQRCKSVLEVLSKEIADLTREAVPQLGSEVWERLAQLRDQALEAPLSGDEEPGPGATESPITLNHVPKLCADVYLALGRVILDEIARLVQIEPLKKEIIDHDAFGENRAKSFIGRASILRTILDYVASDDRHPLAVWGESGSGKSALIAKAIAECRSRMANCELVSRFIGATPASSDGRSLLESLCRQVTRAYGGDEATIPTDYRELVKEFGERLKLATAAKPLIVFLDALDQLSDADHARNLIWLPAELPEHVRLVVSTLPGECKTALERKIPSGLVKLEPMPKEEADELLEAWLKEASRTLLQSPQKDEVLDKFEASAKPADEGSGAEEEGGMPLYLKLAFEEARRWKSYSPAVDLAGNIPRIIRQLFDRLSLDTNHGEILVSRSLGYLAAAKNGLTEDELLDVLARDTDVYANFLRVSRHIPSDLRPHMQAYLKEIGEIRSPEEWLKQAVRLEEFVGLMLQRVRGVVRDRDAYANSLRVSGDVPSDLRPHMQAYLEEIGDTLSPEEWLREAIADDVRLGEFVKLVLEQAPELQLPVILWSRLYFDLEPYLTERSADEASLMSFYHRQLGEVVRETFLGGDEKQKRHFHLADYFASQELFEKEKKTPNIRKLSELPYQQTYAGQWDEVHATLTDFDFLEAKCTHVAVVTSGKGDTARKIYGGVYELQEDYRRALENWGGDPGAPSAGPRPQHPLIVTAWVSPADQSHAVGCPLCRVWSEVPASALGTEIACPHCEGPLKVNSFTINSDWRPVAEAWRR